MKQQKGCVSIDRNNWVCRWRENISDGNGTVRKLRFKVLGEVTAEHRRNKDRKTQKLRVPDDIQKLADQLTNAANTSKVSVLTTIGQFVDDVYLPEKKEALKPGSYEAVVQRWNRHLKARISSCVMRDYERKDAALLWREIQRDFPHLSSQTFRHIRFTVSGIFETAKDKGLYYGENPASASLPANLPGRREDKTQAYSVTEVNRLLSLFTSPLTQAMIALAFGSGLRKGEIAGLDWRDYERTEDGATIRVRRSVYRGHLTTPKTESSADMVHIGPEVVEYIEAFRQFLGGVNEGFLFPGEAGRPINLESFWRWKINPLLSRCGVCHKQKSAHVKADHEYKRDESMPVWKGWHGFRRGNATFLAKQLGGDGLRAASLMLRHSDQGVTQDSYVNNTRQERRAMQATKVVEISETRKRAAAAVGAGLKQLQ
jgi:integrase